MAILLEVSSITTALKGQKLLEKHGILTDIQRLSAPNRQGCGYSLRVDTKKAPRAQEILKEAKIETTLAEEKER